MPWSDRLRRRIKLNDLHAFRIAIEAGGLGRAAKLLNTSQPALSRSIAELERTLDAQLLERSRQGIEPTKYGLALYNSVTAIFDDLRQGIQTLEFLSDPSVGEVRIGGNEAIIAGILPPVLARLRGQYPGISIHVTQTTSIAQQYDELRERKADFILGRIPRQIEPDVETEVLFEERLHVVAGAHSKWSRRRKLELFDLLGEAWALSPLDSLVGSIMVEAFQAHGFQLPQRGLVTGLIHLQIALVASNEYLGIFPSSMLHFRNHYRQAFKKLPVKFTDHSWPVGVMRLIKRSYGPAASLFLDHTREVVKSLNRIK